MHFSNALRRMVHQAGRPEAFNLTVTIAFLALIAQRLEDAPCADFAAFAAANPQLFDKGLLGRWYRPGQLASARARRTFILPDPTG